MSRRKILTHDQRLRHNGVGGTRAVADQICRVYDRTTPAMKEDGALWYPRALDIARDLAEVTDYSVEHVAAAIAHLSPQLMWTPNVVAATTLVTTGRAPHAVMGRSVENARAALASDTPLATFGEGSPKTRRFAANILGDREVVTIDVHAVRVALDNREDCKLLLDRVGMYEALEYAYQTAARRLGICPVTLQATTWIWQRKGRKD
ncbi:hypothetical protein M2302_002251 [Micromonospora sp. A200]|uniref:DUF7178 family protein n=1 Tax=Micromonospora sp. A200 TaxID=2940568 RepID=UPI0024756F1C|nr:hypothetical protein [Micromonospora sp. A200]MDH6462076.1 hypothetical protein [Micromonospora sp. A200]